VGCLGTSVERAIADLRIVGPKGDESQVEQDEEALPFLFPDHSYILRGRDIVARLKGRSLDLVEIIGKIR
jgi:hypothetical protein